MFSKIKAFTLIELLLVIIIIGIAYSYIGSHVFKPENMITVKLTNLPNIARSLNQKPLDFIIFGRECNKIAWLHNGETIQVNYKIDIDTENLRFYRFNYYGELDRFEFPNFQSQKTCFKFQLFKNNSNSSYLIQNTKTGLFYLFKPYFQNVKIFDSFDDAKDEYLGVQLNPNDL